MASMNEATRVTAVKNKAYKPNGLKSYVWLLQKYNINPTMDGPYFRAPGVHLPHLERIRNGGLKDLRRHKHRHTHKEPPATDSEAPPSKFGANKAAVTGTTVPASEQQNDSMYLCPVTIGGQTLNLDFDSGSSDLWVMSSHLDAATKSKLKSTGHNIYDASKASPMNGSSWEIEYGDGSSASGDVVTDTLGLGQIHVTKQAIECAKQLDQSFMDSAGDGLLGLAMGAINTVQPTRVQTPVENMTTQGTLPKGSQLFTVWLSSWRDSDEDDQGQSFYTFGKPDATALKRCNATDFYYTPLVNQTSRGFWEFSSTTFTLNGKVIKRDATKQRGGNTAIADTGTTLALVDDATCKALYGAIKGSYYDYINQGWVFPTNTPESGLPTFGIDVGGKTFFVPKEALLFAETQPGTCYGGVQSRGNLTFDILGDTWLKGVYACFDQGNKRFGCVQRTLKSQNLSVPQ